MSRDEALGLITKELATARNAERKGNEAMVRVCARRAAGAAISFWLEQHPDIRWARDAMNQLREVQTADLFPREVRDAAQRLTTKVTERFTSPFSAHPLDDAKIIIDYFMEQI